MSYPMAPRWTFGDLLDRLKQQPFSCGVARVIVPIYGQPVPTVRITRVVDGKTLRCIRDDFGDAAKLELVGQVTEEGTAAKGSPKRVTMAEVRAFLETAPKPLSTDEIAKAMGADRRSVYFALVGLQARKGEVHHPDRGVWALVKGGARS